MPIINVTLPSDGTSADVADYNTVINAILATVNGQLDDANIASLSGTKITAGTIPDTAYSAAAKKGWITGLPAPNSIVYNGQRNYDLTFNAVDLTDRISVGNRLRLTRTAAAPTQCTNLNGSTQYWVKTAPNKLAMLDDFVIAGWIKLPSYPAAGTQGSLASMYNGTSGWDCLISANGQLQLTGFNGGAGNYSYVISNQIVPLNKWVYITIQLDMSSFTNSATTSYVMFDGIDIPCVVTRAGTNPTALVRAGNLEIGSRNGGSAGSFFPGKIAQLAIFNAKVTQATMRGYMSQALAGTETSLDTAYSFNNSTNDLNATTPNNLSAGAGAPTATTVDAPFAQEDTATPKGTDDFGMVMKKTFSTNTTLNVQVPEGCAIPTTGGISAAAYATVKNPYAFPGNYNRWVVEHQNRLDLSQGTPTIATWYNPSFCSLIIPVGDWVGSYKVVLYDQAGAATPSQWVTLSTSNSSESDPSNRAAMYRDGAGSGLLLTPSVSNIPIQNSAQTAWYMIMQSDTTGQTAIHLYGINGPTVIRAVPAHL